MSEYVEVFLVFAILAQVSALSTVGAVLLSKFWAGKFSRSSRVFLAAILGQLGAFGALIAYVLISEGGDWETLLGLAVFFAIAIAAIGWPVAHFATRKLDGLTENSLSIFD